MTEIEQMIEDCRSRESNLNDWEVNFISTLKRNANNLTSMQLAKLEEICERVT